MSSTPGVSGYKDKVANKFGIQLKSKDSNKQSQPPSSPSIEKKPINTETSTVTKTNTASDFRLSTGSNGLPTQPKTTTNHCNISKTPEPERKTLENSSKSRSSIALVSMPTLAERRNSFILNADHSASLNPVKSSENLSSSSLTKPSEMIKRSSLTPISTNQPLNSLSKERSKSPEPSSIKRMSITQISERSVSPAPTPKRLSVTQPPERSVSPTPSPKRLSVTQAPEQLASTTTPVRRLSITKTPERSVSPSPSTKHPNTPTTTKSEAQIEHQKDQPLYKRQLSKTLDNVLSTGIKNKHQHDASIAINR